MERKIITTADGSKTIYLPKWDEPYHSKHGAVQEALHVFINAGLFHFCGEKVFLCQKKIAVLEIGFGTGLNAYLTLLEAAKFKVKIDYIGVEAYPVKMEEIQVLNFSKVILDEENDDLFDSLHDLEWEMKHHITDLFSLTKRKQLFTDIDETDVYNLIYFDAFGARVQPELWTASTFQKMYSTLKPDGILVTYSAKGSVRRAMQQVGFTVEKLPGPPGKREMLRAYKK